MDHESVIIGNPAPFSIHRTVLNNVVMETTPNVFDTFISNAVVTITRDMGSVFIVYSSCTLAYFVLSKWWKLFE